jgi:hypothetical protein
MLPEYAKQWGWSASSPQESPVLTWQCMVGGQSLVLSQPPWGELPSEQVPPLLADGQVLLVWQVWLLRVEQVPMLGQLDPGL